MSIAFKTPLHPGEMLREEFLVPFALTTGELAKAIKVPRTRIERLVREETGVSTDTALRLARFFGTTPAFWLNLQQRYEIARLGSAAAAELATIEPIAIANDNKGRTPARRRG
jgi:addiction module HigA family antidote